MTPSRSVARTRIVLSHAFDVERRELESILHGTLGHDVVMSTSSGAHVVEYARANPVDLFISAMRLSDGDAIHYLVEATRGNPRPSIIVAEQGRVADVERALDDHVMSYLVEPVTAEDLRPSIHLVLKRFEEFKALREEIRDLEEALRARKIVERAKGLLMKTKGIDEDEAYRRLRELASTNRKKLVEVADAILLSERV